MQALLSQMSAKEIVLKNKSENVFECQTRQLFAGPRLRMFLPTEGF
jgi:hypothetical protein